MTDNQIVEMADDIYRERVLRARSVPAPKKMGWGPELFAESCSRMRSGIRMQFPEADGAEVDTILRNRLARLDQVEEFDIYESASSGNDERK